MNSLERSIRRTNWGLLLCGLASLITWCGVMLYIWTHPFTGPDLRNEFSMFLSPVFAIGITFTAWGGLELIRDGKKSANRKRPLNKFFLWAVVDLVLALVLIAELATACLADLLGLEVFVIPLTLFALGLVVLAGRQHWSKWKQQQG
ncbi:hypothetical protein [Pseudomonas sp. NPDC096950]|uniref:hypothetical protein n=1 Tax=Pseudomonas sp. NPDC096950 TaxID=3364485 RepID=UPI00383B69A8